MIDATANVPVHRSDAPTGGHTNLVLDALRAVAAAFGSLERALRAKHDLARLDAMTDQQLARRGLSRGEIAREVLRRHFPEA